MRYLALNDPGNDVISSARLSAEYVDDASDQRKKREAIREVTRKCARRSEGRLITAPRLLIRGSQVRLLPGAPTNQRLSATPANGPGGGVRTAVSLRRHPLSPSRGIASRSSSWRRLTSTSRASLRGRDRARGQGVGWRRAEARLDPALSSRPGRGVDSVAPPHTESAHTMPRGKRPLVFGQWSHVGSDTAFALRRCRIQPEDAGRGA